MANTRTLKEWDIDVFVSRKSDLISDGWQESTSEYTVEEHSRLYYIQTFITNNSNSGKFDTVKIEEWDIDVFNSKLNDYLLKGWITSGQPMQINRFGKMYHIVTLKKSY